MQTRNIAERNTKKRGVKNKLEREHHKKIILNFLCPFNKLIKCFMVLYWSLVKLQRIKSWPILPKIFTTLEKILKQKEHIEPSVKDFNQKKKRKKRRGREETYFYNCINILYDVLRKTRFLQAVLYFFMSHLQKDIKIAPGLSYDKSLKPQWKQM